jgi:hypothetical protein
MPTTWERGQLTESSQTVLDSLEAKETTSTRENDYSRKLDKDEVKGIWMLAGLLAGSWVLGGIINGAPKEKPIDEHHSH